ncbi:isoleucine--tRNA ligase [Fervidobacterium gondwanense]|uniref:Isoleucine--tRNA ligase n=1 Tax=Fervidobacterium gondwanense DSM 13020 TaxID=1121883 RepID=A0A1M7TER0_FERGO|nr:isoleucine--tRNA ligase [Fervidobacterium gondwanense]SHN69210.1 Isoleucyl-tRNA synthetase [Fervidobacterium gondwanense DSM 13020]
MDYKNTLNLPQTNFQMKANLVNKEPEMLKFWEEKEIYKKTLETREGAPTYLLHDGPPYANGDIHLGTAMNKILKDFVTRYKTMRGYRVPYVPGWDTHGLPIEHRVTTTLGEEAKNKTPVEIRKLCKEFALKFVDIQREEFKRLGVKGDWENPYITLNPEYEYHILDVFKTLVEDGNVYRGNKPVYWCPTCKTALAEAEIEYHDHDSPSIYVKFQMVDDPKTYVVIWTTTPWTIPANVAIALHPEYTYVKIKVGEEHWIVAEGLLQKFAADVDINFEVVEKFLGKELEGKLTKHPLYDRTSVIVLADYVTLEDGTGCVHTAPGHGEEDYQTGLKYNLPVLSPVDNEGKFTKEAGKYEGLKIWDANKIIVEDMKANGNLIKVGKISHSYPHCWRCKGPVMFRATPQWFISVNKNNLRGKVLEEIKKVKWYPAWGENRITAMVQERPDWTISRQRVWGVPIPAVQCKHCGEVILDPKVVEHFANIVKEKGTDAWFEMDVKDLLPVGFKCEKCGSTEFEKTYDTLDVWIDSGCSWEAVIRSKGEKFPVDLYLEGDDQHRGWFQSSIFLATAKSGTAPFKSVVTHGFIKDEQGRKMSKSLGNVIDPLEIVNKYGADILRLWVASTDFFDNIRVGKNIIEQQVEVYRKLRNTIRYLLSNLNDFTEDNIVPYEKLLPLDKWALARLQKYIEQVTQYYEEFEYSKVYNATIKYCTTELSSVYLDILKDRLYVEAKDSIYRRSAQTVLHYILEALVKILAPIIPFTAEEAYQESHLKKFESVHLEYWPEVRKEFIDEQLLEEFQQLMLIRDDVLKALENARASDVIGHSLDAHVVLELKNDELKALAKKYEELFEEFFIVSKVTLTENVSGYNGLVANVEVKRAEGEKCQRCWKYHPETGKDEQHPETCPRCAAVLRGERK